MMLLGVDVEKQRHRCSGFVGDRRGDAAAAVAAVAVLAMRRRRAVWLRICRR